MVSRLILRARLKQAKASSPDLSPNAEPGIIVRSMKSHVMVKINSTQVSKFRFGRSHCPRELANLRDGLQPVDEMIDGQEMGVWLCGDMPLD